MNLTHGPLSEGSKHADVKVLHRELAQLGFGIQQPEAEENFFGRSTRQAVLVFQRTRGLEITGTVDEQTAAAINVEVEARQALLIVRGIVRDEESREPLADLIVRAYAPRIGNVFDLLPNLDAQGSRVEAFTDDHGRYHITYRLDPLSRTGKNGPNIVLRAFLPTGEQVGESDIRFDVGREETIDLAIEAPRTLSEYERVDAILGLSLETVRPQDISPTDIRLWIHDLEQKGAPLPSSLRRVVAADLVQLFAGSVSLGNATSLPGHFYYGLARMLDLPSPIALRDYLVLDDAEIVEALSDAAQEGIIPSTAFEEIQPSWDRVKLERGIVRQQRFAGRLLSSDTDQPLARLPLRATHLNSGVQLGEVRTDGNGRFAFSFLTQEGVENRFQIQVIDRIGETVHDQSVTASDEPIEIRLAVPPSDRSPAIGDLIASLDIELPQGFAGELAQKGVKSLADLRGLGGFDQIPNLSVPPQSAALRRLEAHANLLTLSDYDPLEANALIDEGYDSIDHIAAEDRVGFVNHMKDRLGFYKSAVLLREAKASRAVLDNVVTDLRTDRRRRDVLDVDDDLRQLKAQLGATFRKSADCEECESALSPAAYLADLIDYALSNVKSNGVPLTLNDLQERFHQPFGELPTACKEVEKQIRQVRLCIEVLRRYLDSKGLPATGTPQSTKLESDYHRYVEQAYTSILELVGVSFDELRSTIRSSDQVAKDDLAQQLRLPDADQLGVLFLDPQALTEADLEHVFGLVDTTRDALSEGLLLTDDDAVPPDSANPFAHWHLSGAIRDKNTDRDGYVYLTVSQESTGEFRVQAFKDPARGHLLAAGDSDSADGLVSLMPDPDSKSGLSGHFRLQYTVDRSDIKISAIPVYQSLQQRFLEDGWQLIDSDRPAPTIDPDVVSLAYLRPPLHENPVTDLWLERKDFIDERLQALRDTVPDADDDARFLAVLGSVGVQLTEDELSPQALQFLLDFQDQVNDQNAVLDSEWEQVYGILVQVEKNRLSEQWKSEEDQIGLLVTPRFFRFPDPLDHEERELPEWRATREALRAFEDKVKTRTSEQEQATEAIASAVKTTEEETLHQLRDALIEASDAKGKDLSTRADWVTENLLINAQMDSCLITTRVAQAIDTLGSLLWSIRSGQLQDTHPDLQLDSDGFDEEWKWLGSYRTWRAAMKVFLYPENVLHPALRRWQTPALESLVRSLRNDNRLTPQKACEAADVFADYVNDIAHLEIEATCEAQVPGVGTACDVSTPQPTSYTFFVFARAENSGRVYWSSIQPGASTGYDQSFWTPINSLGAVERVIGAAVYEISDVDRYIFVFVKKVIDNRERLIFVKYNLESRAFEEAGPHELDLPQGTISFRAAINQKHDSFVPPELLIQAQTTPAEEDEDGEEATGRPVFEPYVRTHIVRLSREGNTWDPTVDSLSGFVFRAGIGELELLSMVSLDIATGVPYVFPQAFLAFGNHQDAIFYDFFRPVNLNDPFSTYTTKTRLLCNGTWLGAFAWPSNPNIVYVFWRENNMVKYKAIFYDPRLKRVFAEPDEHRASLGQFPDLGELISIAPHTSAHSKQELNRKIGYQLSGAETGPHLGLFTRDSGSIDAGGEFDGNVMFSSGIGPDGIPGRGSVSLDPDCWVMPPTVQPPPPDTPDPDVPDNLPVSFLQQVRLNPKLKDEVQIKQWESHDLTQLRKGRIEAAFEDNEQGLRAQLVYLEEAFYFAPVLLASSLQRTGHYQAALDWFRSVYDYSLPVKQRKIYYGLVQEEALEHTYARNVEWLLDPLNPHAIASTRAGTYTTFTILSLVQCFLDFADSEFTKGTSESVSRAHTLYMTALDLLRTRHLPPLPDLGLSPISDTVLDVVAKIESEDPDLLPWADFLGESLKNINDPLLLEQTTKDIGMSLDGQASLFDRLIETDTRVSRAVYGQPAAPDFAAQRQSSILTRKEATRVLLSRPAIASAAEAASSAVKTDQGYTYATLIGTDRDELPGLDLDWLGQPMESSLLDGSHFDDFCPGVAHHLRTLTGAAQTDPLRVFTLNQKIRTAYSVVPNNGFCVPPNPLIGSLELYIKNSLFKLRNCRNIAGLEVVLEPYAAPIGLDQELSAGSRGELILPSAIGLQPTLYRYQALSERAKRLAGLAQQMEATFLSILEKRDAEYYNLLKAKQDINLSLAAVRLQGLTLVEAKDGVPLASTQLEKARIQEERYADLLAQGPQLSEQVSLVSSYFSVLNGDYAAAGDFFATISGYEERQKEWRRALRLARLDVQIGNQQLRLALDRVQIAAQELNIADLRAAQGQETLDFLTNKFTGAELYDWMSNILEQVYSTFLQQAASVAQLAEKQLAFERQEAIPRFIQSDYWEAPLGLEVDPSTDRAVPHRRGLTGSARLLRDIFQLDQYAFDTDERKQQLTKTISLARFAPEELQRLREEGVMDFSTALGLFDRDFPGHYLRLIKRVRTSLIALVQPVDGIKATLSTSGISRVVIRGQARAFQESAIIRRPESISLSSPQSATGLFELEQENQKLLPFEGSGVATDWRLELPKAANQFDFNTIADVLITIEYTALHSLDYRRQIVQQLDRSFSADRPFSFRQEFADQWYDLNHPEQIEDEDRKMVVEFDTGREDFPPNLEDLEIQHVVLYFARRDGDQAQFEVPASLTFTPAGTASSLGGSATSSDGIISTRRGNASAWSSITSPSTLPIGRWRLDLSVALSDGRPVADAIKGEEIEDILFVITYEGRTPDWPA